MQFEMTERKIPFEVDAAEALKALDFTTLQWLSEGFDIRNALVTINVVDQQLTLGGGSGRSLMI